MKSKTHDDMLSTILDSRLISPTLNKKIYDIKLVDCGDYSQVYVYKTSKVKTKIVDDTDIKLKKQRINKLFDNKSNIENTLKEIEIRNIMRSKLVCQRFAKANMKDWETFITLTFADNIQDIKTANTRFRYFIDKVRRLKKDFKYLCITEFQKRGAIHYHLLTNININDNTLLYTQEDNSKFKHIKYWNDGFTSIEEIKGDAKKVVGYISKYMTKDIDNRLFGFHRFFYSKNLIKPIENFIDTSNEKELNFYIKKIQDKDLIYQNKYINPYDDSEVSFLEFHNSHD